MMRIMHFSGHFLCYVVVVTYGVGFHGKLHLNKSLISKLEKGFAFFRVIRYINLNSFLNETKVAISRDWIWILITYTSSLQPFWM